MTKNKYLTIFYRKGIIGKSKEGKPITFTDFFGHLVGEHLLGSEVSFAGKQIQK